MNLTTKRILIVVALILFLLLTGALLLPARAQTFTDLHDCNAGAGDPTIFNSGRLALAQDGNFYTESRNGGTSNHGAVF